MTGNAQVDHRKYFKFFTLTTADGQFESLQGVCGFVYWTRVDIITHGKLSGVPLNILNSV